jgi:LacI family transcriptional regulator
VSGAPTIYSIASDLGVHASTVSRAFSRPELITPEIRDRVLARAAEVGYQPNQAARSLVTGRNATVGLVLPDIENPFFPPLVRATELAAAGTDRRVILLDTEMRADRELELLTQMSPHVDGLLIASPLNPLTKIKSALAGKPAVLINRRSTGFSSVIIDNSAALREAATLLAELGHQRIAFLGGPTGSWTAGQRASAIRRWDGGSTEVVFPGEFDASYDGGLRATDALHNTGATAAIAFDDLMACGVIAGLADHGIAVPDGFSIIGCDDVLISRVLTPPMTTITAPIKELGAIAVETLTGMISQPDTQPVSRKIHGILTRRGTTGPPPKRVPRFLS